VTRISIGSSTGTPVKTSSGTTTARPSSLSALELRERFGCLGVVVDAKPQAVGFYQGLGSTPLAVVRGQLGDRPEPLPMFLSVRSIESAGAGSVPP